MPEKRLGQLNYAQMEATFRTNTSAPRWCWPICTAAAASRGGLLAVLSAKVGNIGDNRLGGWYSYRASKAALNMLVKTASIEVARTHPQTVLVALHPGTVNSALSAPFNGAEMAAPAADAAGTCCGARRAASGSKPVAFTPQRRATAVVSNAAVCYLLIWLARSHQALAADLPLNNSRQWFDKWAVDAGAACQAVSTS